MHTSTSDSSFFRLRTASAFGAIALAVAGCSGRDGSSDAIVAGATPDAALEPATRKVAKQAKPKPRADRGTQPRRSAPRGPAILVVTVVDGDTNRRVKGARVALGDGRHATTDRTGRVRIRVAQRRALPVSVRARGHTPKTLRMPFHRRRLVTVRIYRADAQWRMYGANARRTQAHPAIRIRPPFRVVWSIGTRGLVEFPAVVSDGVAYVGNSRGTVFAIDMRRGRRVWTYNPPGGKMASSPAVVGDSLVVHGMDGFVRVLDRSTGRVRWRFWVRSPIESSPVVRGGVDYLGTHAGRVYALDLNRRRVRWIFRGRHKITSSAALAGGTLYVGDYGGRVLALSARTGSVIWARHVGGRVYGTPAVSGRRVFVPSSTGRTLTAFSTAGRRLWRVRTGGYVYSSPAVWGGRVFFGSYDGRLYALWARSGRVAWRVRARGPVSGAAVVVAGVAYAGSTRGGIVAADARNGRVLLRFPHGQYVPVSGNAKRLLLHGYSRIYAVAPKRRR